MFLVYSTDYMKKYTIIKAAHLPIHSICQDISLAKTIADVRGDLYLLAVLTFSFELFIYYFSTYSIACLLIGF